MVVESLDLVVGGILKVVFLISEYMETLANNNE